MLFIFFFFFKQKTAYEMRISDWSSDVCSSDLRAEDGAVARRTRGRGRDVPEARSARRSARDRSPPLGQGADRFSRAGNERTQLWRGSIGRLGGDGADRPARRAKCRPVVGRRRRNGPQIGRAHV